MLIHSCDACVSASFASNWSEGVLRPRETVDRVSEDCSEWRGQVARCKFSVSLTFAVLLYVPITSFLRIKTAMRDVSWTLSCEGFQNEHMTRKKLEVSSNGARKIRLLNSI